MVFDIGVGMESDLNGLYEAAFIGDSEKIKSLLADGADVNGKGGMETHHWLMWFVKGTPKLSNFF